MRYFWGWVFLLRNFYHFFQEFCSTFYFSIFFSRFHNIFVFCSFPMRFSFPSFCLDSRSPCHAMLCPNDDGISYLSCSLLTYSPYFYIFRRAESFRLNTGTYSSSPTLWKSYYMTCIFINCDVGALTKTRKRNLFNEFCNIEIFPWW